MQCDKCQNAVTAEMKFCSNCGNPLKSKEAQQERKQVAVLFSDIVDFTRYTVDVSDDEIPEVLQQYQDIARSVAKRLDGHIAQFLGDGILMYFGHPIAMEDSTERAIQAGLEMLAVVDSLGKEFGLSIRVGIHTGTGVMADVSGEGQLLLGNTPNVAARMQSIAEPNSLVVSDMSYRIVEGLFAVTDLGEKDIKGLETPLRVYRVDEQSHRSRFDVEVQQGLKPLAGRTQELAVLEKALMSAQAGEGQVVTVSAEPGMGKSRLIYELLENNDRLPVIRARCASYTQQSPLSVVEDLIRSYLGFSDDGEDTVADELLINESLRRLGQEAASQAVLSFLGFADREGLTQEQLASDLRSFVSAALGPGTHIVVIEDVHWADQSSLTFMSHVLRNGGLGGNLILLSSRFDRAPDEFDRLPITTLALSSLPEDSIREILTNAVLSPVVDAEVVRFVLEKSDGNPYFAEEMIRSMIGAGAVIDDGEALRFKKSADIEIPATIRDSISVRVNSLGASKKVAQYAAAIGRVVNIKLLATALKLSAAELKVHLDQLAEQEILHSESSMTRLFKHDLLRDVIYDSMVRKTREAVHFAIAESLERNAPSERPELLALHWHKANRPQTAIDYYLVACDDFSDSAAHPERIVQANAALSLIGQLEPSKARDELELKLLLHKGTSMNSVHGYAMAGKFEEVYKPGIALCEKLSKTEDLVPLLYGGWLYHLAVGDTEPALLWRDRLNRFVISQNNVIPPDQLAANQYAMGGTAFYQADFAAANRHYDNIIDNWDVQLHKQSLRYYGDDLGLHARCHQQWAYVFQGEVERARQAAEATMEFARAQQDDFSVLTGLTYRCHVYHNLDEPDEVRASAQQMIDMADVTGYKYFTTMGFLLRAWAEARSGDFAAAKNSRALGYANVEGNNQRLMFVTGQKEFAEQLMWRERYEDAVPHLERAIQPFRRESH